MENSAEANKVDENPIEKVVAKTADPEQLKEIISVSRMKFPESTSKGLEFSWSNINVYSTSGWLRNKFLPKSKQRETKQLLKNVSGCFRSGQLVALMGASGAGKSTLLNVLNLRNTEGLTVEGTMCINAKPVSGDLLGTISAYIQQDDMFFGTLTVREHLNFHARVRMRGKHSHKDRQARLMEVMHNLNLEKCADTQIGIPGYIKGISGGEMKRLAFAAEILTDPAILFCDEPTSGLDSTMALTVVQTLKNMTDQGKAVICTIHQPSSACFDAFNQIILMADGRVAYQGTIDGANAFFAKLGLMCPMNYNPADFLVQQLAIARHQAIGEGENQKKMDHVFCDMFLETEEFANIAHVCKSHASGVALVENPLDLTGVGVHSRYQSSFFQQFFALLWRAWVTIIRDPSCLRIRTLETFFIGFLISAIFYDQDSNTDIGARNMTGAAFMIITTISFQNVFGVCNTFCRELPIFLREHFNGMYRADAYFLAKTFAESPMYILYPFLFVTITYFIIGFDKDVHKYGIAVLVLILVSFITVSFGYLISCIAGQTDVALVLITPMIMPAMLFGGYFLVIKDGTYLHKYFRWGQYISWFYYSAGSLNINQWKNFKRVGDEHKIHNVTIPPLNGTAFLARLSTNENDMTRNLWALLFFFIALRITAFLVFFARTFRCNK